jgi:hypothetical protein
MPKTSTHSRRAALGAIASLSALAVPAAAISAPSGSASPSTASPSHPDAALFALIAAARDAEARYVEASEACDEAENRTEDVPPPDALIVTKDDTHIWKSLNVGDPFAESHLNSMRTRQTQRRPFSSILADARYIATLDDKDRAAVELLAAHEAREDQLVPAFEQWNEARRLARDRSGETAAHERREALYSEMGDAALRVASKRACTLSGILAKLDFIAPDFDSVEHFEGGTSSEEAILASIVVDYKFGVDGMQREIAHV